MATKKARLSKNTTRAMKEGVRGLVHGVPKGPGATRAVQKHAKAFGAVGAASKAITGTPKGPVIRAKQESRVANKFASTQLARKAAPMAAIPKPGTSSQKFRSK